jgi:hypothetical protein
LYDSCVLTDFAVTLGFQVSRFQDCSSKEHRKSISAGKLFCSTFNAGILRKSQSLADFFSTNVVILGLTISRHLYLTARALLGWNRGGRAKLVRPSGFHSEFTGF